MRRSMFFICSSSCSVISSTMGLSFPVWTYHKNHSFHEWGFLAANHPSALANQNVTTNMLRPIRTSQLIICVKSPESLTGYQCSFPHKLKHSNREKDWLILNKTIKWCHGKHTLMMRQYIDCSPVRKIAIINLNAESDSDLCVFHLSTQLWFVIRLKDIALLQILQLTNTDTDFH